VGPVHFIFAALVGFFSFAAIYHFILWCSSRSERLLVVFSADCAARAAVSAALFYVAASTTPAEAYAGLRTRIAFGILMMVTWLWSLSLVTGVKARWFLGPVSVFLLCIFPIHAFVMPLNSVVISVDQMAMPWGEVISIPRQEPPRWWFGPIYSVVFAIELFSLYCGSRLWKRDRVAGVLIVTATCGMILIHFVEVLRNMGIITVPIIGVIPMVLWVSVIAHLIARGHRQTRDKLLVSEQRYRGIFDQTFQFIGVMKPDGTLIDANRTALEFAGIREADVIGKPFWETIWWAHSAELQNRLRDAIRAANAGNVVRFEATHPRLDGQLVHVDFSLKPVRNDDGQVTMLIPEGRDITERKHAEEALRASEERLRAVIANSPGVAVQWYDHDGRVVLWNRASEEMFGISSEEALGQTLDRLIHTPEEFQSFMGVLETIRKTSQPVEPTEFAFRRRNGDIGVCLSTLFHIPGPHGSYWYVCMDLDITERKQAEQALQERETFLRLTQEAAHVGSWEWDLLTNRFKWSDELARMHGITVAEFDGTLDAIMSFCHPDDAHLFHKAMEISNSTGEISAFECRVRRRDGAVRDLWFLGQVIRADWGTSAKVLGIAIDVTERNLADKKRRALEAQLAQRQKMEAIGQLAGGVAHDFNNLLTVISSYSEVLQLQTSPTDKSYKMLTGILDASQRAASLTRQLLTFSRQQVVEPRILDLNAVVIEIERMLQRLIGEDISLLTDLQSDLKPVMADPGQIGQVIVNLVVNARDAMSSGGTLTIKTENVELTEKSAVVSQPAKPGSYVVLTVADTGCGMSSVIQARIFEPFFTTKGPGKGTGLGLATVHSIAEESGGFLTVDSQPGMGSTFKMYLPALASPVTTKPPESGAKSLPQGGQTILLVEDDEPVRSSTKLLLELFGYKVLEASGGQDAIHRVQEYSGPLDLLITDVVMPNMSGPELVERLKPLRANLKVLFMSGYTADAVLQPGDTQANVAFLQKPATMDVLAKKLRQVFDETDG
jgi:PAS domain S-box-containing protein